MGKEVFAELQKREKFEQGLWEWAKAREKGVKLKVFLGDGQKEIWKLAESLFPDYEQILDWMHASQYLWKSAYLWLPESSAEAQAWVVRQPIHEVYAEGKPFLIRLPDTPFPTDRSEMRKVQKDGSILVEGCLSASRTALEARFFARFPGTAAFFEGLK